MDKPIVLDGDKTCLQCANQSLCHGRISVWDFIIHTWNSRMPSSEKSLVLFNALAGACGEFDYQPELPAGPDEVKYETLVIQVAPGDYEDVEDIVCDLLEGRNAKLYTHDMKEIV